MRSLPDQFELPPANPSAVKVQGMRLEQVWPHVLGRDHIEPEEIQKLSKWMLFEQQVTGHQLIAGNEVHLLIDGPKTFDAMFAAMRTAVHHIHLETFIIADDEVGQELAQILIDRRRAGVQVRMIIDAVGALDAKESYLDHLRENGIEIHKYHPINPFEDIRIWRINTRHHRKMTIVDGHIGFLGGINISGVYASSSFSEPHRKKGPDEGWRDTHLMVKGPVVGELQALFVTFWADLHGSSPLSGTEYFPDLNREGGNLLRMGYNMALEEEYEVYLLYLSAIEFAQESIWITQGYFSPDRKFLNALKQASRRGVDVRLLLPGVTDSWITISSSRHHYEELLKEGIRIFERRDVLQHAKTAVIDGIWSIVGSTNLDHRGFMHSNEANVVIWGRDFGDEMQALFLNDQTLNLEIFLSEWRQRPFRRKMMERFASIFDYWL
jgi:cardiolipin synthase A/B